MNHTNAQPDEIDVPEAWQGTLHKLGANPGCVLILGAIDTGKSTLARVLIRSLCQAGRSVAWVDCDVGQSDLGPPTTVAMQLTPSGSALTSIPSPDARRFVGSTSPRGHLLPMVAGTQRMVQLAKAAGAEAIVINTTGMVWGGAARALNLHLVEVIRPDLIVALQAGAEIEHLLRPIEQLGRCHIHRLPVSRFLRPRSREARRDIRRKQFQEYFRLSRQHTVSTSEVSVQNTFLWSGPRLEDGALKDASAVLDTRITHGERCGNGVYLVAETRFRSANIPILEEILDAESIWVMPASDFHGRLVGLCDSECDLLALGLLQEVDWVTGLVTALSPIDEGSIPSVRSIQFGSLKLDPSGVESPLGWPGGL